MKKLAQFIHHLFVPKEKNNFRAKALHHDFLTGYLVFALVVTFLFRHMAQPGSNVLGYATDISTKKLFQLSNEERVKAGLSPLMYNDRLSQAAEKKGADMFAKNYWAHYGPDGETPWQFILGAG